MNDPDIAYAVEDKSIKGPWRFQLFDKWNIALGYQSTGQIYINVGVDQWGFAPVSTQELVALVKEERSRIMGIMKFITKRRISKKLLRRVVLEAYYFGLLSGGIGLYSPKGIPPGNASVIAKARE